MRAEIPVSRSRQFLEVGEVEALGGRVAGGERRHDAQPDGLVDDLVGSVHRSGPPHPEAAENKSAAVDCGEPERESGARPDIPGENERGQADNFARIAECKAVLRARTPRLIGDSSNRLHGITDRCSIARSRMPWFPFTEPNREQRKCEAGWSHT